MSEQLRYRLATSSYKAYRPKDGLPIQASLGHPKFWKQPIPENQRMLELAPHRSYFRAEWHEFNRRFLRQLDRHGVDYLISRFNHIGDTAGAEPGTRLVVLCFEDVPTWESDGCHRALFRHWWCRQTGEIIPELSLPDSTQESLFTV